MRRPLVVLLALVFLLPSSLADAVLAPGGTFIDDDHNTHEGNIEAIVAVGVTFGCDAAGSRYCPADVVTRAQMASFLARAFELPPTSHDHFLDDDGSIHEDNINRVAEAGITLGIGARRYDPNGDVTREQMASFLVRALDLDPSPGSRFTDVSGVHEPNVNALAEAGITLGCDASGTRYCPTDAVRRDQMASFLARALGLEPIAVPPRGSTPPSPGVSCPTTGDWTGRTSQDKAISFTVEDADGCRIAGGLKYDASDPAAGCRGGMLVFSYSMPISEGRFATPGLTGAFSSTTTAAGTFERTWIELYDTYGPGGTICRHCGTRHCSASGTWTATATG